MPISAADPAPARILPPRPPRNTPCASSRPCLWERALPAMNRPRGRRQAGFTLLELLIVLSIIAIGSALVIPSITSTDDNAFRAQVRQAQAALNHARRVAIVRSTEQTATFRSLDPDAPPREQAAPAAGKAPGPHWESEEIALRFRATLEEYAEEVDEAEVTFFPQGGSTGGILTFRQNDLRARIRIDPITGRIETRHDDEDFAQQ